MPSLLACKVSIGSISLLVAWTVSFPARAEPTVVPSPAAPPSPRPASFEPPPITLSWLLPQLLPSPELAVGAIGARFGFAWQVTPLSYSFAVRDEVPKWRMFVVEPLARHGGSVEAFLSPEYFFRPDSARDHWVLRGGIRTYVPLVARGEYLSISFGTSAYEARARAQVAGELGIYGLGGIFGFQVRASPGDAETRVVTMIRIRFL
jgi:hypothetical protein